MAIRITPLSMSLAVFALTVGFLMRERFNELIAERMHSSRAAAAHAAGEPRNPWAGATRTASGSAEPEGAAAVARADPAPHVQPAAEPGIQTEVPLPEPDASTPEARPQPVPVTLAFQPGEGRDPREARLQNLTNGTLAVSITATDLATQTQSMAQVTIAPHRRADLLAAGLSIHSGDEVRVTNPQYSDLVFTAQ